MRGVMVAVSSFLSKLQHVCSTKRLDAYLKWKKTHTHTHFLSLVHFGSSRGVAGLPVDDPWRSVQIARLALCRHV